MVINDLIISMIVEFYGIVVWGVYVYCFGLLI